MRRGGFWHQVASPAAGAVFTVLDPKADIGQVFQGELFTRNRCRLCSSVRLPAHSPHLVPRCAFTHLTHSRP